MDEYCIVELCKFYYFFNNMIMVLTIIGQKASLATNYNRFKPYCRSSFNLGLLF